MKRLIAVFLLAICLLSVAGAEEPQPESPLTAVEALLAEQLPEVELLSACWISPETQAVAALYATDEHIGLLICEREADRPYAVTARNDHLFIRHEEAECGFDGWPEDEPDLWYAAPDGTYLLWLSKASSGDWFVQQMLYHRDERGIQYVLSDDARFIIVSDADYPRVWWPIGSDIFLTGFDVAALCGLCDRAIAYLYDEELQLESLYAYRVEEAPTP